MLWCPIVMKILVFGAGAVGSVLGGMLARMGHDVALLGRARHLDAVAGRGLFLKGLWGEYRIKTFDVYTDLSAIPAAKRAFDLVLLTVKSFDTASAVEALAGQGLPDCVAGRDPPGFVAGIMTALVSFQNGLGNVERVLEKIPARQFLPGRIITGCELTEPGTVEVTVSADDLLIGELPGQQPVLSAANAANLFRLARVPARASADIMADIWLKAIYNCALNGPCSVLGVPYGRILDREEDRRSLRLIVGECYAVAAGMGVRLDPPNAASYHDLLVNRLIPVTAAHYPSMLRDLERGRRTEIEALNGAIGRFGRERGVPTPENDRIADLIREKSRQSVIK